MKIIWGSVGYENPNVKAMSASLMENICMFWFVF